MLVWSKLLHNDSILCAMIEFQIKRDSSSATSWDISSKHALTHSSMGWNFTPITKREIQLRRTRWLILVSIALFKHVVCATKPSFTVAVIEELHKFKKDNQIDAAPYLDRNLKMVAFNFARLSSHPSFMKMMSSIYELPRDKEMFLEKIHETIAKHNYKDVRNMLEKPYWSVLAVFPIFRLVKLHMTWSYMMHSPFLISYSRWCYKTKSTSPSHIWKRRNRCSCHSSNCSIRYLTALRPFSKYATRTFRKRFIDFMNFPNFLLIFDFFTSLCRRYILYNNIFHAFFPTVNTDIVIFACNACNQKHCPS